MLHISDAYFPRINGVSTSIQTFINAFRHQGHEVDLIAPDYGVSTDDETGIIRVPGRAVVVDPEDRMMHAQAILRLTARLRAAAYDLIHIHTPFVAHYLGTELAKRLGLRCVETYHTYFEHYLGNYVPVVPRDWLRGIARQFSRWQCNSVDAVVVPSRAMSRVLRRYGVSKPMSVVPTGIDLGRFSAGDGEAFRRRHGIPLDRPTLVHVGRLAFEKNVDFLLHALARVKEQIPAVLLIISGEGPARAHLGELTQRLALDDHVRFFGYLNRADELIDCYRAGDAFVFASRTETQGLVLLEAMALGVPVVSTAVMGTRDVLRAGRGTLVAREDPDDFAACVVHILTDATLRARLAREAQAFARAWSAPRLADRMMGLYQSVLAGTPVSKAVIDSAAD